MRNKGKRWMALVLAVVVTCVNLFISGGNVLEVQADSETSEDFVIDENGVLTKYNGAGGDVVIPEGVTSIGDRAFYGCSGLTGITMPESVTSIGGEAFCLCSNLTNITLPANVTSIGWGAFQYCRKLKNIIIPEGVTKIDIVTFGNCSSLTSITIPESVTGIWDAAFEGCRSLVKITIPEGVEYIGERVFSDCSGLMNIVVDEKNTVYDSRENCNAIIKTETNELIYGCQNTIIPKGVTNIGNYAFASCSGLSSITIPESVTSIGYRAFDDCSGLRSIIVDEKNTVYDSRENCNAIIKTETNELILVCQNTIIPKGVTSIGSGAFSDCSGLTSIAIPEGVTSIGSGAFSGCSGLTSITIPESVTSIDSWAFGGCSGLTSITIPENVSKIEYSAFEGCSGLTSITIPESVTSIGSGAFCDCSGLTSITIPENVRNIEYSAFEGCSGLKSIIVDEKNKVYDSRENCNAIIKTETNELIAGCQNTIIPKGVTSIGGSAFNGCSGLTSITIPDGVTSIEYSAFDGCSGLTSITIPDGVTSIGNGAFSGCSGLTSITIPESVTSIIGYNNAFVGCSGLRSIIVDEKNTVYDSRENCNAIIETETNKLIAGCQNTIIPKGVTSIGEGAFSGCSGLISITIPESVTSIGYNNAFAGCSGLRSIIVNEKNAVYDSRENCNAIIETKTNKLIAGCQNTIIPKGVTSIGYGAFSGCSGLTSITIPESVTSINSWAFSGCSGLTSIIVNENNTIYDSRENCNAIIQTAPNLLVTGCQATVIPKSVTSIGAGAFSGCSRLTSITIPDGVTSIGFNAFGGCSNLRNIMIPRSVTSIAAHDGYFTDAGCWGFDYKTMLLVEEGSYGAIYAREEGYNYRTFSMCDATDNPVLSKETVDELIAKNANNDIVILSNNDVQFTFDKGTMKEVEGLENYDFGTTVTTEFADAGLPDSVTEEEFVAKISYNYSGQLPGEASIKIPVGKEYTGKRMLYSLIKDDNTLGESQSAKVDLEGYITVKQSHCSAYVITLAGAMMGDTNNDGSITAEDALAILKQVVGLEQLTGDALTNADVNADSAITAEDALDVLKKVVGLISEFKAEATN